jgi:galacturonosyltransferase
LKIPYAENITGLGTAFQNKGLLRTIVTILYKVGLKKAKVVFFENEENRQIFVKEKIVPDEKTCLLMGAGVNLERYNVEDYPNGDITKFLFMGRVMKEKGIDELFIAMRRLQEDGIKCSLDVLGYYEEDYKEKIEQYESEGWLHYYGYQKDVKPYINDCHCFVLPSWHEGMANTNLECAASGRPVITCNIHGCMEAVEDGVSGYLCKKKNAENLYQVMKKFIELPYEKRKAMGLAGRKRMRELFDRKVVIERTMSKL